MDTNTNIALSLIGEDSASKIKTQVFEEELKEINSKFPMVENQVDIRKTYLLKNEKNIEVGILIRNTLKSNVSIEEIPLVLQDQNGSIILSKKFNFKEYGVIPPFSARPLTVNFEIDENINLQEDIDYIIKFGIANDFIAFSSVATEIENIPIDLTFEEEKAIKDFANELPTLKADEFTITIYKMNYNEKGGIDCTFILRNGSNKAANLERLPISIVNRDDIIITRKVFGSEQEKIEISPKKSKLVKFTFAPFELPAGKHDLSKCKVLFK